MTFTYVPILKWKRGEQQALQCLKPNDKAQVRPLVEVLSESIDEEDPEASFDKFVKQLDKHWSRQSPIFVDLGLLEGVASHPVTDIFDRARLAALAPIPVTGLGRGAGFQADVAVVAATDKRGLVLRVTPDDIAEETFAQSLDTLLATLGVAPNLVDVVIDAGFLNVTAQVNVTSQAFMVAGFVSTVIALKPWRSCTYAASAFPGSLAEISGAAAIPRVEWDVWKSVRARLGGRQILFGDYAIAHPIYAPVAYAGAANIRYTIDGHWLIQRGRKVTGPQYGGFSQYVTLSQSLLDDPRYSGKDFSWGDKYIFDCANELTSTGNMTTWRAVATNHHITFVVKQLASFGVPSVAP